MKIHFECHCDHPFFLYKRKQGPKAEHQQLISNEYSTLDNPSGVSPPTNFAEDGRIFPRIKATNGAPSSRATADNPTNFYEGGAANRGYVPEREYRNDNVSGCFRGSLNVNVADIKYI